MKILFWLIIAGNVAVLLLFFVLGLAAATSTKSSSLAVAAYMLGLPGLFLALSVFLFVRVPFPRARGLALLLAAAPMLIVLTLKAVSLVQLSLNMNAEGEVAYFRAGPMREIAEAIKRNDAATVRRLIPQVDVNAKGFQKTTLLVFALRQMEDTPTQLDAFRALMEAKPDPNIGTQGESPLELAFQVSSKTGPEPVALLLKAKANPNVRDMWGSPAWYGAIGHDMGTEVLSLMLDNGADIKALDKDGRTALFDAANATNWKAVLLLLERGVDWKQGRSLNGSTFPQVVEEHVRLFGTDKGVAEVVDFLKKANALP